MKFAAYFFTLAIVLSGYSDPADAEVELICLKTHKASNTCYFNFRVDGVKYSYTDAGCKQVKKKKELIRKVKEGRVALSRDWKIDCPQQGD